MPGPVLAPPPPGSSRAHYRTYPGEALLVLDVVRFAVQDIELFHEHVVDAHEDRAAVCRVAREAAGDEAEQRGEEHEEKKCLAHIGLVSLLGVARAEGGGEREHVWVVGWWWAVSR